MAPVAATRVEFGKNLVDADPNRGYGPAPRAFFADVQAAGQTGRVSERLKPLQVRAAAGSDENSGNEGQFGAFLVPRGFSPNLQAVGAEDPTAALTTKIEMTVPVTDVPALTDKDHTTSVAGGLTASRRRQTTQPAGTRAQGENVTLNANTLWSLVYGTNEIAQDSVPAFMTFLTRAVSSVFTARKLTEKLFGNGAGEPLGAMNSPALITVAKETGQVTKTIVTENIDNMAMNCWHYSRAIWLANEDAMANLKRLVRSVGSGGNTVPLFTVDDNGLERFDGRLIVFTEFCQTVGTPGDLILGVWSEYLEGTLQPFQSQESVHVRFETNESAFKFFERGDGAPWWKTSLTPHNSTTKKSPFIALAAR